MKFFKFLKSQKGFTLIELLVVIGVLGILATGLLATIDPLEQFRKGADSNSRTTALELTNSLTRYYAVHGTMPWDTPANGGANCNAGGTVPAPTQVSTLTAGTTFSDCLNQLVTEGELKSSFPTQYSILGKLWIADTSGSGAKGKSVSVCYEPTSKSEMHKPDNKWAGTASGPTITAGALTASACDPVASTCPTNYWCSQ